MQQETSSNNETATTTTTSTTSTITPLVATDITKSSNPSKKIIINKEALLNLNTLLQQQDSIHEQNQKKQEEKIKLYQECLSNLPKFYELFHTTTNNDSNDGTSKISDGSIEDELIFWKKQQQQHQRIIPPSAFSLPSTPYFTKLQKDGNEIREVIHTNMVEYTEESKEVDVGNNAVTNSLKQRPLQGNLTSKLLEYTRGQVGGKGTPFIVKGMKEDADLAANDTITNGNILDNDDDDPLNRYKSEECTLQARKVLDIGVIDAYKDDILILSPPGLNDNSTNNTIGIRFEEVYGDDLKEEHAVVVEEDSPPSDQQQYGEEDTKQRKLPEVKTNSTDNANSNIWEDFFLEEDSLFGSDDESSSSVSSDDGVKSVEPKDKADEVEDKEEEKQQTPEEDEDELIMDEDEIDVLLDLTSTSTTITKTLSKQLNKQSISAFNSKNQITLWAVTSSLRIPNNNFEEMLPNPAQIFPFELDTFQKQAVLRLERNQSVFLSAHTSAGKTVVAEYAISLALKHCTRAIYTSPIKALSNQKYRDFQEKFGSTNVGLITGDVQMNPDATCLIMTTEILRSMLYRGADLIRDVEWVIFDEVHYINDIDRGVVWEEVIIMLPDYVHFVFLSATTPNTMDFSDWIGRTKQKLVHVIKTDYRPVPLSHYLFSGGKLHKIMEGSRGKDKRYLDKGWTDANKALTSVQEQKQQGKQQQQASQKQKHSSNSWHLASGNKQNWISLVKFLNREGLMPTVIFSFSKKKCEEVASMLRSLDLNTANERNAAYLFTKQTISRLSPIDAKLPQVLSVCELVCKGIGVHHGGLLPILKEMVEILFSRNLIKVLFATETFAMGVNMPAKAVVFSSIRKHDGMQFRTLQPGEYTQMAGRAGRRGLDKVGTVILCCFGDAPPPSLLLKNMLTGSSHKLTSRFRLTYNMILNLLRVEDMTVEGMIKRSFSEFQTQRALVTNQYPNLLKRGLKTLEKLEDQFELDRPLRVGADDIEEYYFTSHTLLQQINAKLFSYLFSKGGITGEGSFVPGRVLLVTCARKKGFVCTPALLLKPPIITSSSSSSTNEGDVLPSTTSNNNKPAICLVLLPESFVMPQDANKVDNKTILQPGDLNYIGCSSTTNRYFGIYEINLDEIMLVSQVKYKIDSKILYNDTPSTNLLGSKNDTTSSFSNSFANAKSLGGRQQQQDDPFANFTPARGKKDLSSANKTTSSSSSKYSQCADEVVSYLLEANVQERKKGGLSSLNLRDCIKNLSNEGNSALEFRSTCDEMESYLTILRFMASHTHPSLEQHYTTVERKETLRLRVKYLQHSLSNQSLRLFPDFLQRKALLNTLNYIDDNDNVCMKGRVACEVNTCEELIVTEMLFEGLFNNLHPAEIVASLSALVFQEKTTEDDHSILKDLPENLIKSCLSMKDIALNLGILQKDHGITIDPYNYATSCLKFGLVHVVYEWACGVPFFQICELTTTVQEGSIVRCITRLDELCRDVRNCARVVGNPTLYRKMEDASVLIKRDIVFATSLYVS